MAVGAGRGDRARARRGRRRVQALRIVAAVGGDAPRLEHRRSTMGRQLFRHRRHPRPGRRAPDQRPNSCCKLGWAAGTGARARRRGNKVLIGKDTRISGYMFESALEAGLVAAGMNIRLLGPMPTPAIAYLTRTLHACAGIVISASHNPVRGQRHQVLLRRRHKLPDEVEAEIEARWIDRSADHGRVRATRQGQAHRGRRGPLHRVLQEHDSRGHATCAGLKIVVDCAHGATYHVAPRGVRRARGAR